MPVLLTVCGSAVRECVGARASAGVKWAAMLPCPQLYGALFVAVIASNVIAVWSNASVWPGGCQWRAVFRARVWWSVGGLLHRPSRAVGRPGCPMLDPCQGVPPPHRIRMVWGYFIHLLPKRLGSVTVGYKCH